MEHGAERAVAQYMDKIVAEARADERKEIVGQSPDEVSDAADWLEGSMPDWSLLPEWRDHLRVLIALARRAAHPAGPVHWAGEPGQGPTSLHGNGAASFALTLGDEDEVTCKLCLTLLARTPADPHATDTASQLERGGDAPTQVHVDGSER